MIFKNEIKRIIEYFIQKYEGEIAYIQDDLWEIRLPPGILSPAGDSPLLLAFSGEYRQKYPDSLLMTPGSSLLLEIREILLRDNKISYATINPPLRATDDLIGLWNGRENAINIKNASSSVESIDIKYKQVVIFYFLLTIIGEEKIQEVIPIFFDLLAETPYNNDSSSNEHFWHSLNPGDVVASCRLPGGNREANPFLKAFILKNPSLPTPPAPYDILSSISIEEGYKKAVSLLESKLAPFLEEINNNAKESLENEILRLNSYFDEMKEELKNPTEEDIQSVESSRQKHIKETQQRFMVKTEIESISTFICYIWQGFYRIKISKDEYYRYIETIYDPVAGGFLPVICPRCSKETTALCVCKEHGVVCDNDSWECPVCHQDRCELCEYYECGIDGRKKCADCTFTCQFCDTRVGRDRKIRCDKCGKEGCTVCIRSCIIEGKLVCADCGGICSTCEKPHCNEHLSKCDLCSNHVCSVCSVKTCAYCRKKGCRQHAFTCASCGKGCCKECMGGICAITGEKLCKECVYTCQGCGKTVQKFFARRCEDCGKQICKLCARECTYCHKNFCKEHFHKCSICKESVCRSHSKVCPACGSYSCRVHFHRCEMCLGDYCEKCNPSRKEGNLCNLCDNLKPLMDKKIIALLHGVQSRDINTTSISDWTYSEGKEVIVFFGKSFLNSYLLTLDQQGKLLNINKIGIMKQLSRWLGKKG